MDKRLTILLGIALFMSSNVAAAENQTARSGIDLIYNALESNSEAVRQNSKKIDAMNDFIESQYRKWVAIYVFGSGCFMAFLYGFGKMFGLWMKRRGLQKSEEYINDLHSRIKKQDKYLLRTLKTYKTRHENTLKLLKEYEETAKRSNSLIAEFPTQALVNQKNFNSGFFFGMAAMVLVIVVGLGLSEVLI